MRGPSFRPPCQLFYLVVSFSPQVAATDAFLLPVFAAWAAKGMGPFPLKLKMRPQVEATHAFIYHNGTAVPHCRLIEHIYFRFYPARSRLQVRRARLLCAAACPAPASPLPPCPAPALTLPPCLPHFPLFDPLPPPPSDFDLVGDRQPRPGGHDGAGADAGREGYRPAPVPEPGLAAGGARPHHRGGGGGVIDALQWAAHELFCPGGAVWCAQWGFFGTVHIFTFILIYTIYARVGTLT